MADEQRLGMPAGSNSGQSGTVAAGFKVDSSSLQQLHKTWRILIQDVSDFNKQLVQLNQHAGSVDKVAGALSRLHSSLGGRASANAPSMNGSNPGGANAPASMNGKPPGQVGPPVTTTTTTQNMHPGWGVLGGAVAYKATVGAAGSYMQSHLQSIVSTNDYYNQSAQAASGAYGGNAATTAVRQFIFGGSNGKGGLGSVNSAQDLLTGQAALENTWGLGLANRGNTLGNRVMSDANRVGALLGSYSQGASVMGSLGSPQVAMALRRVGITSVQPGTGAPIDPETIAKQLLTRVFGGKMPTSASAIASSSGEGRKLRSSMDALGLNSADQSFIIRYGMAYAQSGGGVDLNLDPNTHRFKNTVANQRAGVNDNISSYKRSLDFQKAGLGEQTAAQSAGMLKDSMASLQHAVEGLTHTMGGHGGLLSKLFTGTGMLGMGANGLMGLGSGVLQYTILNKLLHGGGSEASALTRATGGLGLRNGMSALVGGGADSAMLPLLTRGLAGGAIAAGGTVASQAAASLIRGKSKPGSMRNDVGNLVGDIGTGAALGAGFGTIVPGVGTAIGAGVGALGGLADFAWHKWGDGSGSNNPWAQSGSTIDLIEAMGKPTGAIVTSAYRPGGTSYHAAHEAVDFGVAGNDPAGLLKINKFWASKYGTELAELIYTGPGGTTIKNGKVVPPDQWNSFWGSSTVAEHKNHVHVAATPASLRMGAGGVATSGKASGSNGNTATVQTRVSVNGASSGSVSNFGSIDVVDAYSSALLGGNEGMHGAGSSSNTSSTGKKSTSTATSANSLVNAPGSVKDWATQGLKLAGKPMSWLAGMVAIAMNESGGKNIPQGVNDINMQNGTPAFGPWQMIQTTFSAHAVKGHTNWKNPIDEAASSANYIGSQYGDPYHTPGLSSISKGGGYRGYATGTWELVRDEIAQLHKGEMVLPEKTAQRVRSLVKNNPSGHGSVVVNISAPITVSAGSSLGQQDADAWWRMVKSKMEEDSMLARLGSG